MKHVCSICLKEPWVVTLLERLRETASNLLNLGWWRWRLQRVHWKRVYFAVKTRTWPWRVPAGVAIIALRPPPDHVVAYFRRLHGIDPPLAGEEEADTPNA